jgi:hypothetical protein
MTDIRSAAPVSARAIEENEVEPPHNLPLSDADRANAVVERAHVQPMVRALSTPPRIAAGFVALGDDGTRVPPDVHGAVSPTQLVVALNSQIAVEDRSGNRLMTVSLQSFWSSVATDIFDPEVFYDRHAGRWVMTAASSRKNATSGFVIGVSRTADATGMWDLWKYDGDSADTLWFDHPDTGITTSAVVVTGNMYKISDNTFDSGEVFYFDKAALYAGNGNQAQVFGHLTDGSSMLPVTSVDDTANSYLIQSWNGDSGGKGYIRLYTVTSSGVNPVGFLASLQPWQWDSPTGADFEPQAGSSMTISAGDDRFDSAVYRNGSVWTAHTVYLPSDAATHTAVQWWQISVSPLAVVQRGVIEDPSGAMSYAFPSIAVNRNNDVMIAGTQFGSSIFATAFFAFHGGTDSPNTSSTGQVKAGEASYYKVFGSAKSNRWGDYTATVVDPANDNDFWTVQQYAGTPSGGTDRWSTWWSHLAPSSAPANALQMISGRYAVTLFARDWRTGKTANGVPSQETDVFGYFSLPDLTGNATNPEVFVKVIGPVNGVPWIFYAGLTDMEYTVTVTDQQTGQVRQYSVPKPDPSAGSKAYGNFDVGGVTSTHCDDVSVTTTFGARTSCFLDGATLCLIGNRFKLTLTGRDQRTGNTATAVARTKNDLFGFFSLPGLTGDPTNIEVFVKMLDATGINQGFWAFLGGLTDFEYTLRITDTATGKTNTYLKPASSTCGWNHVPAF